MKAIVIGGSNATDIAKKISRELKLPYSPLTIKHFPDGELYVRFTENLQGKTIILVQSMHPKPNEVMMETILAINTAKKLGAQKVILVAPYIAYLRQDKMFHSGECVSNKIIAGLLSCADRIVTIDPHLHRINNLGEIFTTKTTTLTAMHAISRHLINNKTKDLLIGPDIESTQWASRVAQTTALPFIVLHKKRYTAHSIRTKVTADVRGKNVIIIDDIISTGRTMVEPILQLKKLGAKTITCIAVHGLFAENALTLLKKTGAKVLSTNTIQTKATAIDVSPTIAEALKGLL